MASQPKRNSRVQESVKMTSHERVGRFEVALERGEIWRPDNLSEEWQIRKYVPKSIEEFMRCLRRALENPDLHEGKATPSAVGRLVEAMMVNFRVSLEAGIMDEVLPRMSGLPVLYRDDLPLGAGRWEWAAQIYRDKMVGQKAPACFQNSGTLADLKTRKGSAMRDPIWSDLANACAYVIQVTCFRLPQLIEARERALGSFRHEAVVHGKRSNQINEVFELSSGQFLVWPRWLSLDMELPVYSSTDLRLVEPRRAPEFYLPAFTDVVNDFFADSANQKLDEVLQKARRQISEPRYVSVSAARRYILRAAGLRS